MRSATVWLLLLAAALIATATLLAPAVMACEGSGC